VCLTALIPLQDTISQEVSGKIVTLTAKLVIQVCQEQLRTALLAKTITILSPAPQTALIHYQTNTMKMSRPLQKLINLAGVHVGHVLVVVTVQ
jgi:hypothetical protein